MTELRTPPARRLPDLEAEQEVDFGRYWSLLASRWWLPLAGLVIGLVLGYLTTLGGNQVYQARAVVYLGQPLAINSSAQIQSVATNPTTVSQVIHAESTIRQAAARAGLRPDQLRGKVSSQAVSGAIAKQGQTPLVGITVKGAQPRKVALAANALAAIVVQRISGYVNVKIQSLQEQVASYDEALASNARRLQILNAAIANARGLTAIDQLVLVSQVDNAEQRRTLLVEQSSTVKQQLTLAQNVERGRVLAKASPVKTTAKSRRNSLVVGGLIGLIVGILAALLWDRIAERAARRPSV